MPLARSCPLAPRPSIPGLCPPPRPLQLALCLEASEGPIAVSKQLLLLCINEEQVEAVTKDLLSHRFYGYVKGGGGGHMSMGK